MDELALGAPLGDGASGDVFASSFRGALLQLLALQGCLCNTMSAECAGKSDMLTC